jgi:phosphoenolpyruvate carboxylase
MTEPFELLKAEVDLLGRLLGEAIRRVSGERFFALVEEVRLLAKARRQGDEGAPWCGPSPTTSTW